MTNTDINESYIIVRPYSVSDGDEINTMFELDILTTLHSEKEAEALKQQILQNQKDAQEYREAMTTSESIIIDLHKAIESLHEQVRTEKTKHVVLWRDFQDLATENNKVKESCRKLQSQHKKLVDAIQNRIKELELLKLELSPSNNQHLIYTKQIDILKETLKPLETHQCHEYCKPECELQNLLKESEK